MLLDSPIPPIEKLRLLSLGMVRDVAGGKPDGKLRSISSRWPWRAVATLSCFLAVSHAGAGQVASAPVIAPPAPSLPAGAQTVSKVPSTIALTITTPTSVFYGQAIDGLAQVTATDGSAITGTVTFYDGTTSFCTLTIAVGASCPPATQTAFGAGSHVFTAVYSGDATHAGATSNAVPVTVAQDTTTTTLASSTNPVPAGSVVAYTAAVAGAHGTATGIVSFFNGTVSMGSVTLDRNGSATLSVFMLDPGDHAVTAVYAGNANSAGSASSVLDETVQQTLPATTTTLAASVNPAAVGDTITFTSTVTATTGSRLPSGTVTFVEGATVLATATLNASGTATWSTSALSQGSHNIVARYAGDTSTAPSLSAPLTELINDPIPSGTFTLKVDQITVVAGETAIVPVKVQTGSGFAKAITLSCSGLPEEASCSSTSATAATAASSIVTLKIKTAAPRDCGTSIPYGTSSSASLPVAGRVLAALFLALIPKRRRAIKGLFAAVCAITAMSAITGCGTGNCTDLGTRPGTYTITITGSAGSTQVSHKVKLIVKP
jgi:predicted secreted protein